MLKTMTTKPANKFIATAAGSPHGPEELKMIANFLDQVPTAIKKKNAA
jgi:hypothetical protein